MTRTIIDIPLAYWRTTVTEWLVDWRTQSAGGDAAGGEQVITSGFPRFTGRTQLVLPPAMIGHWRALMMTGEGRKNAWRVRMFDPATFSLSGGDWLTEWQAVLSEQYVEPRPRVPVVGAVSPGASYVVVNESELVEPIRVGAFLSYSDWPFVVTGRSGSGASVTLTVKMLRVGIPDAGLVDVIARGVFVPSSDMSGQPMYVVAEQAARPEFELMEWITR
jgi:hypothetical protein